MSYLRINLNNTLPNGEEHSNPFFALVCRLCQAPGIKQSSGNGLGTLRATARLARSVQKGSFGSRRHAALDLRSGPFLWLFLFDGRPRHGNVRALYRHKVSSYRINNALYLTVVLYTALLLYYSRSRCRAAVAGLDGDRRAQTPWIMPTSTALGSGSGSGSRIFALPFTSCLFADLSMHDVSRYMCRTSSSSEPLWKYENSCVRY